MIDKPLNVIWVSGNNHKRHYSKTSSTLVPSFSSSWNVCSHGLKSLGIANRVSCERPSILSRYTLFMKYAHIGNAIAAPWPYIVDEKCISRSSPPTQHPATRSGTIPMNQASELLFVVPVLAAISPVSSYLYLRREAVPPSHTARSNRRSGWRTTRCALRSCAG